MEDTSNSPEVSELLTHLAEGNHEEAIAYLEAIQNEPTETRKTTLRSLQSHGEDSPETLEHICSIVTYFLTDDNHAV